ncbi:hypothetical protein BpHYR1_018496 [Brachionus plicatilis]|uniref:Uncharacterized protein n=1 Tax=Brachionus plicatilis TaxID=10195 RepID=A0A3M7Q8Q7_BRAPC|nr:hypothetical protein BpHYR1_018496 [Brachionus plicatilis]
MSKTKVKNLTTFVNSAKSSHENNFENSSLSFNQSSFNLTSSTTSNTSSSRKQKNQAGQRINHKKRQIIMQSIQSKDCNQNSSNALEFLKSDKKLPSSYYININQDGFQNMDKVNHLNNEDIENQRLELQLRPISGLRNHVKRNQPLNVDLLKDTDFIQRIGSIKTLKRLDLSYNNLDNYPRQLCDLNLLESLNLTGMYQ